MNGLAPSQRSGRRATQGPLRIDIAIPRMALPIGSIDPLAMLTGNSVNEALAPFLMRPSYGLEDAEGPRTVFELRLERGQGPEIPGPMGMPGFGLFHEADRESLLRISGASTIVWAVAGARPDLKVRGPERLGTGGIFPVLGVWLRPVVGNSLLLRIAGSVAINATFREATP